MSASMYVEHGERGFWAYDVALGVLLKFLIDEALAWKDSADRDWLDAEIANWRVSATISDFGFHIPEFRSDHHRDVTSTLLVMACAALEAHGPVGATEAREWNVCEGEGVFTRGAETVEVAPIIELGRAIIQLIDGSLPPPPEGRFWFYGTPDGRTTLAKRSGAEPGASS